jgi:hypothetical protein
MKKVMYRPPCLYLCSSSRSQSTRIVGFPRKEVQRGVKVLFSGLARDLIVRVMQDLSNKVSDY